MSEANEMHALALRMVERIEAEAAAIRVLHEHSGTWWGDLDKDDRETVRAARETLELRALVPNQDAATDVDEDVDEWEASALSITANGSNSGSDWNVDSVTIVLTTGGPHVEVVWAFDRATLVAYGWFGADRVEMTVDADAVELLYYPSSIVEVI